MTRAALSLWAERGLLGVGGALCLWTAVVLLEARATERMPVPEPPVETATELSVGIVVPARGAWFAKLDAPTVALSATVLEGSDDATLRRGAGHIEYTPSPGQTTNGNVGIAGHRDTTFRPVEHLEPGDPIVLTTSAHVYRYRVTKTFIVNPEDVHVLEPGTGPMLTLVTCFPFEFLGNAPQRFIVQADLVDQARREPESLARGSK